MTESSAGTVGPGTLLAGRYRLEDLLVESSGAWFWRATDTVLSRNVAVHAVGSADDRAQPMLEAARLSATVNDPHLLRVLDCDHEGDVCWVVHEWGEGLSLDLLLQRGPLAPDRAAWLAKEVADAVAAGHAQGVAHGRLNPEAVLVTHSGGVKLIGYVVDASLHDASARSETYGDLDPFEADVVDVAAVLYAALTGRWPGASGSAVPPAPREGARVLRPRQVRAGVPRPLDAICDRVLHREGSRHELPVETARELADALAAVTGHASAGHAAVALGSLAAQPVVRRDAAPDHTDSTDSTGADEPTQVVRVPTADGGDEATAVIATGGRPRGAGVDTGELEATQATPAVPTAAPPVQDRRDEPAYEPYVDSPDRPLFSDRRRAPAATTAGAATGVSAAVSAPAAPPPEPATGEHGPEWWHRDGSGEPVAPAEDQHEGRGWLRTAVVVGLVLLTVVAMVAAFTLGRRGSLPIIGSDDDGSTRPAAAQPITVEAVADVDPPPGNGEENPGDVGNAIDGDPATTWSTVTYYNRPDLGGLKSGVGLMLDLGSDQRVRELDVRFGSSGTSFEVYAAPEGASQAPSGPDDMERVGGQQDAGETVRAELDPAPTTRYVLLWLTGLPEASGGYRGEVAEVSPRT